MFFELLLKKKKHNIDTGRCWDYEKYELRCKNSQNETKKRENFSKFGQPCLERNTKQDFVEVFCGEGVIWERLAVVVMGKDWKRREVGSIGSDDGLIAGICGVSVLCTCSLFCLVKIPPFLHARICFYNTRVQRNMKI